MYCKITTYSHYFTVTKVRPEIHSALNEFILKQVSYTLKKQGRRWFRVPDKMYATRSDGGKCYRFHINHLKDFKMHLKFKGYGDDHIESTGTRPPVGDEVDFLVNEKWSVRPTQVPIVDYLLEPGSIKVVSLQMGQGKTFCSLYAAAQESTKLWIQVLARFTGKWYEDVKKTYDITDDRILQIRGLKALMKFMRKYDDQPHRNEYDIFIISTNTWIDYIKDYEKNYSTRRPSWYIKPQDFTKKMGIGQKIVDEVHMHFHWNFKVSLYDNISKVTYLSATLDELDDEMSIKMYNVLVPKHLRRDGGVKRIYTDIISMEYTIRNAEKLRYKGDKGQYSHVVLENSIRKNKELYAQYLDMFDSIIDTYFIANRTEKQKALVFFALTEMCADFRDLTKERHPELVVNKYTSEDDIEVLDESDHISSTLGSSGTAIDIPNLLVCVLSVALSKSQTNLQAFGRLRDLGDSSDVDPIYIFMTCVDIEKHRDYCGKKISLLRSRAKTIKELSFQRPLIA